MDNSAPSLAGGEHDNGQGTKMIDALKNIAARQVGRVLASDATMKVLSNPNVQSAMMRAINFRAEARDVVEERLQGVMTALDLVTADDVAVLKRKIRDLEDQVVDLRDELDEASERVQSAEDKAQQAADAQKQAQAAAKQDAAASKPAPAKKAPARRTTKAKATAAKKTATSKTATTKGTRRKAAPKKASTRAAASK